jgi:hypothetical protein
MAQMKELCRHAEFGQRRRRQEANDRIKAENSESVRLP